ncbi:MAG: hypothetical protein A2X49_14620 [Lentisphaerae bacterium GWF2_52_8]|nr:MAG: hypothetical protein A2X49_14620 [Lentisphaerae bacterium GWF2_52_8]
MDSIKTEAEYQDYIHKLVRLKLWFVWDWLQKHPDESISSVLRNRVDIFRKTEYYDPVHMNGDSPDFSIPGWLEIEDSLKEIWESRRNDPGSDGFEEEAFLILRQQLDSYTRSSYEKSLVPPAMKCGSLTYNSPAADAPDVIAVHIANALQPASIFDDPLYLPHCLRELMEQSSAEFGVSKLHCGSWLNSHPRWLALFPQEWTDLRGPEDHSVQWHFGFWGQFITAKGTFHERNASKFRSSGEMPFPYRTADCSFDALQKHLAANFSGLATQK